MLLKHVKVVVGGQGGDELFGGYARYLICYFEQALKHRIRGTDKSDSFVLTLKNILPNLELLSGYEQMIQKLFKDDLFGDLSARYFSIINRSNGWANLINKDLLNHEAAFQSFEELFYEHKNFSLSSFDLMTRFDFKSSLRGLLQVEDRMSMAHGLESRVPLLDHKFIEFASKIPANIKYKNGEQKRLLKLIGHKLISPEVLSRTDKMGISCALE